MKVTQEKNSKYRSILRCNLWQSDAGLASVTVMPTFRYGWSFYAAVAAFINAELAAGLYIVLHTHLFKRFAGVQSSVMTRVLASSRRYGVTAVPVTTTKEVGVQTFVEKPRLDSPGALSHTEVYLQATYEILIVFLDHSRFKLKIGSTCRVNCQFSIELFCLYLATSSFIFPDHLWFDFWMKVHSWFNIISSRVNRMDKD